MFIRSLISQSKKFSPLKYEKVFPGNHPFSLCPFSSLINVQSLLGGISSLSSTSFQRDFCCWPNFLEELPFLFSGSHTWKNIELEIILIKYMFK